MITMKHFIFGHRGSPLEAPENTLLSVEKAMSAGVDAVEIDVRKTKMGHIVVIHDAKVDRTTNGKGFVEDFTLNELQNINIRGSSEKIPLLQEIIDIAKKKIKLIIEIKDNDIEKHVIELIEKNKFVNNVYLMSFNQETIKNIKKINNKIKTGLIFKRKPINLYSLVKEIKTNSISAYYKIINKNLVNKMHKENIKVFVWNIDSIKDLKHMLQLDVDGIGTNKPSLLIDYFKK